MLLKNYFSFSPGFRATVVIATAILNSIVTPFVIIPMFIAQMVMNVDFWLLDIVYKHAFVMNCLGLVYLLLNAASLMIFGHELRKLGMFSGRRWMWNLLINLSWLIPVAHLIYFINFLRRRSPFKT